MRTLLCAIVLGAFANACSGEDSSATQTAGGSDAGLDSQVGPDGDAGADATEASTGKPPPVEPLDPPAAPALPAATCPTGWNLKDLEAVQVCDPWPQSGLAGCLPGRAHFVGAGGCEPIGSPCPDKWPTGLPEDATTVFVDAAATSEGAGTRVSPKMTLRAALASVTATRFTVALAKWTYVEDLAGTEIFDLPAGAVVIGACAQETILEVDSPSDLPVFGSGTDVAQLIDLTITGERPAAQVLAGATLYLDGIVIDGVVGVGVIANGTLIANDLLVQSTRPFSDGTWGVGINVFGGDADLTRAVILENTTLGINVEGPAANLRANQTLVAKSGDYGVAVIGGAKANLEQSVLQGNTDYGVAVDGAGSLLTWTAGLAADTVAGDPSLGIGVSASNMATANLSGVWVRGSLNAGVGAHSAASVTLVEAIVSGTQPRTTDAKLGIGVLVFDAAQADLRRTAFVDNVGAGLAASGAGTSVTAGDLVVSGAGLRSDCGRGISIEDGATLSGQRLALTQASETGILVAGEGAVAELSDVTVLQTSLSYCETDACVGGGVGLVASEGGQLALASFFVAQSVTAGVQVAVGGEIDLTQGEISDNPIALNIRQIGYDEARLTSSVSFRQNDVRVDSSNIPTPFKLLTP